MRSFEAPREKVWEALVVVFKPYPMKIIEGDRGYIETEPLKGSRLWKAPGQKSSALSGHSAVITARISGAGPVIRVFIHKRLYRRKGFISQEEEILSDGLEEAILFRRLALELRVKSLMEKTGSL